MFSLTVKKTVFCDTSLQCKATLFGYLFKQQGTFFRYKPTETITGSLGAHCEQLALYFIDKFFCTHASLDKTFMKSKIDAARMTV